ncbi:hypothetical protein LX81_04199 [Palleronia aestuarii]|uniref:Uncharacterized protein n=1 Tax=Palleronia aestuarii TaxID=568105 RepID=A0A2W7MSN7_9RHOB|nr:hypothetical protein LX81_04199 [Palleronia aestuarii]
MQLSEIAEVPGQLRLGYENGTDWSGLSSVRGRSYGTILNALVESAFQISKIRNMRLHLDAYRLLWSLQDNVNTIPR